MSEMPSTRTGSSYSGLDAVGIQDSLHLKNSLINCDDPIKAISDFQEENSIQLPTLKPALNLLDLHNVKRLDFHLSIFEELKEALTKRIEELAANISSSSSSGVVKDQKEHLPVNLEEDIKKLEYLLDKSFPLIQ
jgi:negative elongation factor B